MLQVLLGDRKEGSPDVEVILASHRIGALHCSVDADEVVELVRHAHVVVVGVGSDRRQLGIHMNHSL